MFGVTFVSASNTVLLLVYTLGAYPCMLASSRLVHQIVELKGHLVVEQ